MSKTLYVIGDGGRARFVERTRAGAFRTIRALESTDIHARSRDLRRAPPDRAQESANPARHAFEPRVDERDRAEEIFIRMVAGILDEGEFDGDWKNIVLVLPPRLLKHFWRAMRPDAAAKVRRTISKNLARMPDSDLGEHLPVISSGSEIGSGIPW